MRNTLRPAYGDLARHLATWSAIGCAAAQFFIAPDVVNLFCAAISCLTLVVTAQYALRQQLTAQFPISTLMIIGLCGCTCGGALIVQTCTGRPLNYNLDVPLRTFAAASAYSLAAVGVHLFYRHSQLALNSRKWLHRELVVRVGLFTSPSSVTLWIMGAVGVFAVWLAGTHAAASSIQYGDVRGKLLQAFIPFAAAPFLIPFLGTLMPDSRTRRGVIPWMRLAFYGALLVLLAIARNSRGSFAVVVLLVGLCTWLLMAVRPFSLNARTTLLSSIALIAALLTSSVLSDISTAMLITRAQRANLSAPQLIKATIETVNDRAVLQHKRSVDAFIANGYNEIYIANPFLARLVVIKFLDLNISHAVDLSPENVRDARETAVRRLFAGLPTPILGLLHSPVNKNDLRFSSGDLYRFFASQGALGGYTSGSSVADGMVIFGPIFWILAPVSFFVLYTIFDSLCGLGTPRGPVIGAFACLHLPYFFSQTMIGESVAGQAVTLFRELPQDAVFYIVALLGGRFADGILEFARLRVAARGYPTVSNFRFRAKRERPRRGVAQ